MKIKEEKNTWLLIDYDHHVERKSKIQAIKDNIGGMSADDLAQQNKIHEKVNRTDASGNNNPNYDADIYSFFRDMQLNDKPAFARMIGSSKMGNENRKHYKQAGLI